MTEEKTKTEPEKNIAARAAEEEEVDKEVRWYHFVAAIAAIGLVVAAFFVILNRFDLSLVGAEATMRIAVGCSTNIAGDDINSDSLSARFLGVKEGDMFIVVFGGEVKRTDNEEEANFKIREVTSMNVKYAYRKHDTKEWIEDYGNYGNEMAIKIDDSPDCVPKYYVNFSK